MLSDAVVDDRAGGENTSSGRGQVVEVKKGQRMDLRRSPRNLEGEEVVGGGGYRCGRVVGY